jgi:hypothetical protein
LQYDRIDAYYYFSTRGDKEAYSKLYKCFVQRAENQLASIGFSIPISSENCVDFYEFIDELFIKILNEYEAERSPFSGFVDYVIKTRLANEYSKLISNWRNKSSYEEFDEVEHSIAATNLLTDSELPSVRQDIEISNFRFRISSGKFANNKKRFQNKIIMMLYAGYKPKEIEEKLKISRGKLRNIMNEIKKDEDILNLKLEIK